MKRFEYYIYDVNGFCAQYPTVSQDFNGLGKLGWELVCWVGPFAYFKREIPDA